jgi:uncharacterized protein YsxB (DUF464 family)
MLTNKGSTAIMILFSIAFIALVAAVYIYESNDSKFTEKLKEKAAAAEKKNKELEETISTFAAGLKKLEESHNKIIELHNKSQEKIAWLEMKSQNSRPSLPAKIHLTLDPIQTTATLAASKAIPVSIAYRRKKAEKPAEQQKPETKIIQDVKRKLKELSQ